MATLQELRGGLERTFSNLAEGWRHLRERTGQALTHFSPRTSKGNVETGIEQISRMSSRWSLLSADVMEEKDQITVKLEAPGMDTADFDIHVADDLLVVRGEKYAKKEDTHGTYHTMECAYGGFERVIPLPMEVDEGRGEAKYRRGVLKITFPKRASQRRRKVEIQTD